MCADAGVGVAVLKVGASAAGAPAAAAHTGAVAGDHRVFRALVEEAGAAWAADVHDLLELAKALAVAARGRRGGGTAILTCSGGDSGLGADEAARVGSPAAAARARHFRRCRDRLPDAATVANPLDYTAMIWGEVETLRDLIRTVGEDPAIGHVLVFYDRPPGISGASLASWAAVEEGILAGAVGLARAGDGRGDAARAARRRVGVAVLRGGRAGGRGPAHRHRRRRRAGGAAARRRAAACDRRPRRLGRRRSVGSPSTRRRRCFARRGVPVPSGRLATDEDDAVSAWHDLARPSRAQDLRARHAPQDRQRRPRPRSARRNRHPRGLPPPKGVRPPYPGGVRPPYSFGARREHGRARGRAPHRVRRDAVVPVLVVGLGGIHVEALDRVALVPLPADRARIERALQTVGAPPQAPQHRRADRARRPRGSHSSSAIRYSSTATAPSSSTPSPRRSLSERHRPAARAGRAPVSDRRARRQGLGRRRRRRRPQRPHRRGLPRPRRPVRPRARAPRAARRRRDARAAVPAATRSARARTSSACSTTW